MIDMTMDVAQKAMDLRDAIVELRNDPKYKMVFEDAYFTDEAARLALATVDDEMQDDIEQRIVNEKIRSIGHLHVFLNARYNLGNIVEEGLKQEEKERVDATKTVAYDEITGDAITGEI